MSHIGTWQSYLISSTEGKFEGAIGDISFDFINLSIAKECDIQPIKIS